MDGTLFQPPNEREVHGEMPCMFSCCRNDDSLDYVDDNYTSTTKKDSEKRAKTKIEKGKLVRPHISTYNQV